MASKPVNKSGSHGGHWRIILWSGAALLLLLPLIAMQFTDEVNWTPGDFLVAGALLLGVGITYELVARTTRNTAYRTAAGVALAAVLILVWVNGAVGMIGSEDNLANQMYFGVLAVGVVGTLVARFQPRGMARALIAMALAQGLVTLIAVSAGLGEPWNSPLQLVLLNGFFIVLYIVAAQLFLRAAPDQAESSGDAP